VRLRPWHVAVAFLSAALLGTIVYFILPTSASVHWRISSQPPGAELVDPAGQVIGKTPTTLTRPRDIGRFEVMLRLPGHQPERIVLDYGEDTERSVQLSPEPR
jgi:hypothetical protein